MSPSSTMPNQSQYFVLFVDDEEKTRKAFSRLFADEFKILLAGDGAEGFEVFQQRGDEIGVIITDQKMPRETGVQFLSKVAAQNPDVVRILSTAYAELEAAISGVNEGGIYRYVTKPWDVPELEITLRRAMELFELRKQQSNQEATGSLDVAQVLQGERVAGLAMAQAARTQDDLPGTLAAGMIFKSMLGHQGLGSISHPDWKAQYDSQYSFFESIFAESVDNLSSQTQLDWGRTSPPSAAIQAASAGCEAVELEFSGGDSSVWPGPAAILCEILRPLIVVFSKMASDLPAGTCRVKGNFNTVDFQFSGFPLKSGLHQLATDPEGFPILRELFVACLQVAAVGGRFNVLDNEVGLGLRLGFERESSGSTAGQQAVASLSV